MVGTIVLYLFVLSILVTLGDGNTKQKRLLLNDPDVANRLASMESMLNILTQQMKEMKSGGDEEEEFLRMAAVDRQRVEQERIALQDQLDEERRRRLEAEKRAQAEIDQLKLELAAMKHTKPPSRAPSTSSRTSTISRMLFAPPPSRASRIATVEPPPPLPPVEEARTPTPAQTPAEQRQTIIRDFLQRAMHGLSKVAHGEGEDKEDLDRETDGYLQQNVRDIKKAQKEVFGKTLGPGDFDKMPPKKQQDTSEKMIKLMQKWREERRARELAGRR